MAGTIIKTVTVLAAVFVSAFSENLVLINETFPYRVVSGPGWVESFKNDSVLLLNYNVSGKRNQFRLERHTIDSASNQQTREWSRLQYTVSKEFAAGVGRQIYADSGEGIRLGGCQAYETFSYFTQLVGSVSVWFAEFARWTEKDGYGFLASIIGDTLEMKRNLATHAAFLDSISFTRLSTPVPYVRRDGTAIPADGASFVKSGPIDMLGRMLPVYNHYKGIVLVRKQTLPCLTR